MIFTKYDIIDAHNLPNYIIEEINKGVNVKFLPTNHLDKIINSTYKDYTKEGLINLLYMLLNLNFHSSEYLRKKIGNKYREYINILIQMKIVINYIPEIMKDKSRVYELDAPKGISLLLMDQESLDDIDDIEIDLDPVEDRILIESDIDVMSCLLSEYDYLKDDNRASIRFSRRMNRVIQFKKGVRKKMISERVNREYNSFSVLSRISRQYVSHNNQYFSELDIANCVPYLLSLILKADDDFNIDCSKGRFYRILMENLKHINKPITHIIKGKSVELDYKNYDDIKVMVMATLLYGNVRNKPLTNIFKRLYPSSYKELRKLKESDSNLSILFFKIESDIILNLNLELDHFTVHDAIYFKNNEDRVIVEKAIYDRVKELFGDVRLPKLDYTVNKRVVYNIKSNDIDQGVIVDISKPKERITTRRARNKKALTLELKEQGRKPKEIMEIVGISRMTYYRYIK